MLGLFARRDLPLTESNGRCGNWLPYLHLNTAAANQQLQACLQHSVNPVM
jgi:hypothetical protein